MARITQKEILGHFFNTFDNGKIRTSSEFRMQAIKLKNLKKVVKEYLESANIKTDKSVEQIIMEAIDYAKMTGCKFNSIASIGYDVLPKSIMYWQKVELAAKQKKETSHHAIDEEEKAISNNKQLTEIKKVPKWLDLDDEED